MTTQTTYNQSIVKDKSGNVAWTRTSFVFPAGSDSKSLSLSGSPYTVSDKDYSPPMEGKIVVTPQKSTGTADSRRIFLSNGSSFRL